MNRGYNKGRSRGYNRGRSRGHNRGRGKENYIEYNRKNNHSNFNNDYNIDNNDYEYYYQKTPHITYSKLNELCNKNIKDIISFFNSINNLEKEIEFKDERWVERLMEILSKISKDLEASKIILTFINYTSFFNKVNHYLNENSGPIKKLFLKNNNLRFTTPVIDYLNFLYNYLQFYKAVFEKYPVESEKIKFVNLKELIKDLNQKCIEFCEDNNNKEVIEFNKISWKIIDIYNEITENHK